MSDSESQNVRVHAAPVIARVSVPTPRIEITTHMWITWAELAIEHSQETSIIRNYMMKEHSEGGNFATTLGRETAEAILTVCSAAFSMDALLKVWARLVMDPATVKKWEDPKAKSPMAASRALEVFKRSVKNTTEAGRLAGQWEIVFRQRNEVVHFTEEPGEPVQHPAGIGMTAEANAVYCQENAVAAADLLMATLDAVAAAAKPKMRKWVSDFTPTLERLRDMKKSGEQPS